MNTSAEIETPWKYVAGIGAVVVLGGLGYYVHNKRVENEKNNKDVVLTPPAPVTGYNLFGEGEEESKPNRITPFTQQTAKENNKKEDEKPKRSKGTGKKTSVSNLTSKIQTGTALTQELDWLSEVIAARFKIYFEQAGGPESIEEVDEPDLTDNDSAYAELVKEHGLDNYERLMLILALASHCRPQVLDFFFTRNSTYDRSFTEFGGTRDYSGSGFLPSVETLLFLVSGDDLTRRFRLHSHLLHDSALVKNNIIILGPTSPNEPKTCASLTVCEEYVSLLIGDAENQPHYISGFPAKQITTKLDWQDLVLDAKTLAEVNDIKFWLDNSAELLESDDHLKKLITPGYRALFYGPPGTGKTLTASLLGKVTGLNVFNIDLCKIDSKYIGDTEKNLDRVFNLAEQKKWILFFDEADILFGKRTDITTSNDRHANEKVAFLLHRMENFNGIVVLATNNKGNIDDAFTHRFQSMIYFPLPDAEVRTKLWKQTFQSMKGVNVDWARVAKRFMVTGAVIKNVLRYCVLLKVKEKREIREEDIVQGLEREFLKDGKTLEEVERQTSLEN